MARLLRFVAVAALVGGATASLTACSGDPGPIVTETPSPTRTVEATPSPTPTPTVTSEEELLAQIPEDARGEDFYSASQFAKFFILEYQRMFDDQDSSLFYLLSEPDCIFCTSSMQSYADLVVPGETVDGGEITIDPGLAQGELQEDGTTIATIRVATAAQTFRDASGEVIEQTPAGSGLISVKMRHVDGHWIVVDVNVEPDNPS